MPMAQLNEQTPGQLWADQAQREAKLELLSCRVCKQIGPIDQAITIWRDGEILYGICDGCLDSSEFLITSTERGIEVRGRRRRPITVGS